MNYKKGDIIIFRNNHTNAHSIGEIIDYHDIKYYRCELIKSGGIFTNNPDNNDYISGWDEKESYLINSIVYNSYQLKYSKKLWNLGNSYEILTIVDPNKHDIYKLADIMNGKDLDAINLTIDIIKNGN